MTRLEGIGRGGRGEITSQNLSASRATRRKNRSERGEKVGDEREVFQSRGGRWGAPPRRRVVYSCSLCAFCRETTLRVLPRRSVLVALTAHSRARSPHHIALQVIPSAWLVLTLRSSIGNFSLWLQTKQWSTENFGLFVLIERLNK